MLKIVGKINSRETKTGYSWNKISRREVFTRSHKSRIHFSPVGETILENLLGGRQNRPYAEVRRRLMKKVLKAVGLPEDTKTVWSQKAGCSCGCSPAFIIQGGHMDTLYWFDVEDDGVEETEKRKAA
jgi:hypothetical protein